MNERAMKDKTTALVYSRVSTVRKANDGLPVEIQIEQYLQKTASLWAEAVSIFKDEGISGRTAISLYFNNLCSD